MRTVAPEIFSDEFFGTLSLGERLLWMGLLLVCADDQGRMLDNSAMLRNLIFPYDDNQDISREMVETGLAKCENAGKILRYCSSSNGTGKKLIQIVNWWKYQMSASWMAASKFPAPGGWVDRCRYHTKGKKIVDTNWKLQTGGFLPTSLPIVLPNPLPTPLPRREDEDEVKDEKEKERESSSAASSSVMPENTKPAADAAAEEADALPVLLKIFTASGTRAKQRENLVPMAGVITPQDCWAMLAWTYSQNKFRKPGVIMAENILSGEHASAEWYSENAWEVIPQEVRQSGGLVIQSDKDGLDSSSEMATRISIKPDETVFQGGDGHQNPYQAWQSALGQIETEMPKVYFDKWVRNTVPIHYEDGLFTIAVSNSYARDWLESRLTSTIIRLLMGIMNRNVTIRFVAQEET